MWWFFFQIIPIEKSNTYIYEADAFETLTTTTDKTGHEHHCVLKYKGPKYAISTPNCAYRLDSDTLSVERTAFVFFETGLCLNASKQEQDNYWSATRCDIKEFPSQVKITTNGNFINCPF